MTTYGDLLTITQINERFCDEKSFQDDIFDVAFFRHPVLQTRKSLEPYLILKTIYDLHIANEFGDKPIYPTDIIFNDTGFTEDVIKVEIDGESYEFDIDTPQANKEICYEYVEEHLFEYDPILLFNNIKIGEQIKETLHIEKEAEEKPTPEIIYDETTCPVCFDEIIDFDTWNEGNSGKQPKMVGLYCGHTLCTGCHHSITHSDNSVCPVCREVWDDVCYETINRDTDVYWSYQDICTLMDESNEDILYQIIDIDELLNNVLEIDGGCHNILGYDTNVEINRWDIPIQYRELEGSGEDYTIMVRKI
jgi:RNA polymerase subunit RPABC4/transcription elongation factor Spt4